MYRSFAALLLILFAGLMCIACKRGSLHPRFAFYHWTNREADLSRQADEKASLRQFGVSKLYVKIMDVDWNDGIGAYPSTSFYLRDLHYLPDSVQLVPVIFITNHTLEGIKDDTAIQKLANKIVQKTEQLVRQRYDWIQGEIVYHNDSLISYSELQFDCDWTSRTKTPYFGLLTEVKKALPGKHITSTLRLHQYRHPEKTGVPPVDEVYLMCYNTGEVKRQDEHNSIYDPNRVKPYFKHAKEYPVRMNFALSVFDWAVIFRQGNFYKIDNLMTMDLLTDSLFARHLSGILYEVRKDTVVNDAFLRNGDMIRWESLTETELMDAANNCRSAINTDSFTVVFYDISHITSGKYEMLQKVFNSFRN